MILTVNIGNTHITVGGYDHDTLRFCGRLHSDPAATIDEYAIRLVNLLSLHGASPDQIEGGILGSVVPVLSGRVLAALRILCSARILTVGPGLKSGIKLRLDNPAQLGAELLCGAVAALAESAGPLVVISADTAISMMAVNEKHSEKHEIRENEKRSFVCEMRRRIFFGAGKRGVSDYMPYSFRNCFGVVPVCWRKTEIK